jgi:fumarate hydratase subunit alpha
MRNVSFNQIVECVKNLYIAINHEVRPDYMQALEKALKNEKSDLAKHVLQIMLENYRVAKEELIPMCQDTGTAIFFVEIGRDIQIEGNIEDAINEGVRHAAKEGYLRTSMVNHPATRRINTRDNTPALIHIDIVPGEKIKIHGMAKGGGSENKSRTYALVPIEGKEGVKRIVLETVKLAGANACPPFVVGVGIGGSSDKAPFLAKKALLREIGSKNPDPELDEFEKELLEDINKLGIGPQGLGGTTTAVAVFIESYPCHIASLPVAVCIQCNAYRHKCIEV